MTTSHTKALISPTLSAFVSCEMGALEPLRDGFRVSPQLPFPTFSAFFQ